jgi:hypothetical protein
MRAAMRKREAIQPRNCKRTRAEADVFAFTAGSNAKSISETVAGSAGVRERGEHTKVVRVYLGGLADSAK